MNKGKFESPLNRLTALSLAHNTAGSLSLGPEICSSEVFCNRRFRRGDEIVRPAVSRMFYHFLTGVLDDNHILNVVFGVRELSGHCCT